MEAESTAVPSAGSALERMWALAFDQVEAIRLACVWEAAAPKVGNVHPGAAFADCDFQDFCRAAAAIAPILAGRGEASGERVAVGQRIRRAIEATRRVTDSNVNLGIVLLLGPLVAATDRADVSRVLAGLTREDGTNVYRAIALANPGGVRAAEVAAEHDVTQAEIPPVDLIAAMRSARERDRIARQYADDFVDFFERIVPVITAELSTQADIGQAILRAQLSFLAAEPDSLIRRKCGDQVAAEVQQRATACRDRSGDWDGEAVAKFDRWLRADGNRRNPGTTADLIAAGLYWSVWHGSSPTRPPFTRP